MAPLWQRSKNRNNLTMQNNLVAQAGKRCANCGQFKLQPRRISVIAIGILFAFIAALLVPWNPFFEVPERILGLIALALFIASVFVKGQICTNCKAQTA